VTDWDAVFDGMRNAASPLNRNLPGIVERLTGEAYHKREHLTALTDLLTNAVKDVANGKSRKIVVSMPPGLGKSINCSVGLPIYTLANHPSWNVAVISAEASLAYKFSRDARTAAPEMGVKLKDDSGQVQEWETLSGGGLLARGVGGTLTGRRVKVMIIDDPIKDAQAAYSEVERESLQSWYKSVARTRLAPVSLALLVMTRWHEDDLAAYLLQEQGWEEFRLPALSEGEDEDPIRRPVGHPLLTPQDDETVEKALERWKTEREEVGAYVWAGLYQQRPAPADGAIFNVDHLRELDEPIDLDVGTWVTSWDLGFGTTDRERKKHTDFTVGTVWQRLPDGRYILHDLVRGRWEFTEQLAQMRRLAARYPQCSHHLVEAAANGAAAIDSMKRDSPGVAKIDGVTAIKPIGSKIVRWQAATPTMEAGRVCHVGGSWLSELVAEMAVAPNGKHDDQLDSVCQALNWLRVRSGKAAEVNKTTVATRLPGR
jgi:predicted phage terminase large subunit-like protein